MARPLSRLIEDIENLEGGVGDDTLIGDENTNWFVFRDGFGKDIVISNGSADREERDILDLPRKDVLDFSRLSGIRHCDQTEATPRPRPPPTIP